MAIDIWKHGKYVDMWSIVHFLSGFLLCGLFYALGSDFLWSLGLSLILLMLWEVFEYATKIIEVSVNVVADIIIGLLGFGSAALLYYYRGVSFDLSAYLALVFITFILALWGFVDYYKNGHR